MTDEWCDCDWEYRKKITIDHNQVAGDETDFPVLISLTDADLADTSNGGHMESSDGYDIRFYTTTCSELEFEIEYYDNTTGEVICWVKIPSLSSTSDTEIYIYYGNNDPAITGVDPSSTDTWDANFSAVWHFTDVNDSTAGGNNLTNVGATANQTGIVHKAYYFDGTNDYMHITPSPFRHTNDFTYESWVKRNRTGLEGLWCDSFDVHGAGDISGWLGEFLSSNHHYKFMYAINNSAVSSLESVNTFGSSLWFYIAHVKDSSNGTIIYRDGISDNNDATVTNVFYDTSAPYPDYFEIGDIHDDEDGRSDWLQAWVDETRVSSIVRSANWIGTTFATIDDPATFFSTGIQELAEDAAECSPGVSTTACGSWWLIGESSTVTLNYPLFRNGHNKNIRKDIKRFNFWSGNYRIYDNDIVNQPLMLEGIEYYDNSNPSLPNLTNMESTVSLINDIMNNEEEVEVDGLSDCIDDVFVIRSFNWATIKKVPYAFRWRLVLEKVRDAE